MESQPGAVVEVRDLLAYLRSERFLDKKAAAGYLDWSIRKLETYLTEIPHYRHGGKIYFKKSELDEYMEDFRVEGSVGERVLLRQMADEAVTRLHRDTRD